jgi:aminoglycoside 6'-N-acetyltransferase I
MIVRPAALQDRDQWLEMRKVFWPDGAEGHASEIDRFLSGKATEPQAVLVAEVGKELVGFAELSIRLFAEGCVTSQVGYLEGWFVKEDRRGDGIGRALLEASEDWARERGCAEFASDTQVQNEPSVRAHLACGFEDAGTVRCFRKTL